MSGHKGAVTKVAFMKEQNIVISSSKDSFVKFWDLDTEHCFNTIVDHQTEVWSFALLKNDKYLVVGSKNYELRVWRIFNNNLDADLAELTKRNLNIDDEKEVDDLVSEKYSFQVSSIDVYFNIKNCFSRKIRWCV